jgi:hypothetical protein
MPHADMGNSGIAPVFSTSALHGGRFTSRAKAPSTRRLGGWVCPGTGLDAT